jgi:cobalt-zinc-cadmium efflux system outer membrane protein
MLTLQTMNINPGLGVGAGSLRSKTVDSSVRIDQLLERAASAACAATAPSTRRRAREDVREARRQLRLAVSQAYYDALAAGEREAILGETAQLYQRTVDVAQTQRKAGRPVAGRRGAAASRGVARQQ